MNFDQRAVPLAELAHPLGNDVDELLLVGDELGGFFEEDGFA